MQFLNTNGIHWIHFIQTMLCKFIKSFRLCLICAHCFNMHSLQSRTIRSFLLLLFEMVRSLVSNVCCIVCLGEQTHSLGQILHIGTEQNRSFISTLIWNSNQYEVILNCQWGNSSRILCKCLNRDTHSFRRRRKKEQKWEGGRLRGTKHTAK